MALIQFFKELRSLLLGGLWRYELGHNTMNNFIETLNITLYELNTFAKYYQYPCTINKRRCYANQDSELLFFLRKVFYIKEAFKMIFLLRRSRSHFYLGDIHSSSLPLLFMLIEMLERCYLVVLVVICHIRDGSKLASIVGFSL